MSKINLIDLQKRKLEKFYMSLIIITKDIKIRNDDCFSVRKLYIILGTDIRGCRQVIGTYFENDESNRFWLEVFEDLKARGLEFILFLVTPVNKNLERCAKIMYNTVTIVTSPEEIVVDITRFFADKHTRTFIKNLKDLFFAQNLDSHKVEIDLFEEQFATNKIVLLLLKKRENEIKKFYEYDLITRKFLYPFYAIRDMKKYLHKLNNMETLCTNLGEINMCFLEYINTFESGRSYYKTDWLELLNMFYEKYPSILEEYLDV